MKVASTLWLAVIFLCNFAYAGRVRTLPTSSREMPVIQLMTGRSTVIRLPSAPKKVVLGNQNYFNVEFIDSDITIQPQGVSSSNLFVYGDGYTYGFILKVNSSGEYDDLVFIRGKLPAAFPQKSEPEISKTFPRSDLKYELKAIKSSPIELQGSIFRWNDSVNAYFSDVFILSKLQNALPSKSLEFKLVDASGDISSIAPVIEDEILSQNKKLRIRVFSKLNKKENIRVRIKLMSQELDYLIKWKK